MLALTTIGRSPRGTRFRELAASLRQCIDRGELRVGARLPSEQQLAAGSGVSVNTVRRAIALLVEEGLVDRRHGSGTYVIATTAERRRRYSIGVLVPSVTYYYPQVIAGIEHAASHNDAHVVLACSGYDVDRELAELERLVESGVDGLLLVPNLHRSDDQRAHLRRLAELPIPYVLVERRPDPGPMDRTSYVCTDVSSGAYAAVAHLAVLGRRRIGHLGYLNSGPGTPVFEGYRAALHDSGLELIEAAVLRKPTLTMRDVGSYVKLCGEHELDAVLCLGDPFAATLVRELGKRGMAVPRDVAVVTFDDEFAHLAEVPLTAVSPPKFELGRLATDLLVRHLEAGSAAVPYQVRLPPSLVVRDSCGARPASEDRDLEAVLG
jgi:GntR family transcriptional regulator, arabinose operon transcriptional repressor